MTASLRVPRWWLGLGWMLCVAAGSFVLVLWALPPFIMSKAMGRVQGAAPPAAVRPPMTDHRQRQIVMPSPDLLYGVCVWDLSARPLRVRATLGAGTYSSIALYSSRSDNFLVVNDRQVADGTVDLWLIGPQPYPADLKPPTGARTVISPSIRGLLLMRVLLKDREQDLPRATALRDSLVCGHP